MDNRLAEMSARLGSGRDERRAMERQRHLRGRLGEFLIEAWLLARHPDEVLRFPDDPGTKRDYLVGPGKRPDFLVTLDPGEPNEEMILVDAKLHAISESTFWMQEEEFQQYTSAITEWRTDQLYFAVIDANQPNAFELLHYSSLKSVNGRREFRLGEGHSARHEISKAEYEAGVALLALTGFAASEAPAYP